MMTKPTTMQVKASNTMKPIGEAQMPDAMTALYQQENDLLPPREDEIEKGKERHATTKTAALQNAQTIANHESPKATKLYDRASDQITLDEVERTVI
ncbi:hypothetical protein V5E97_29575 [Singulisphaera sp. Ch08]|uniref:Uncharacterized protein n=1 Tax=Singulisphaera sp. Ch08 TaxID=3120278 RepID=A0AAU7CAF4_9BACT